MYHDAERRKEAAEINASLYALRECVRFRRMERQAAASGGTTPHVHVPYRCMPSE
jgi:kinesin family protein 2/24